MKTKTKTEAAPAQAGSKTSKEQLQRLDAAAADMDLLIATQRVAIACAEERDALRAHRDALVEALRACERELTDALTPEGVKAGACLAIRLARATLARVQGGGK